MPFKGKVKVPKSLDPPSAFDCSSPGLKSIYPSGAAPGKKGKAVKGYLATIRKYIPVFEGKVHRSLGIAVCLDYPKQYSLHGDDSYANTSVLDPLNEHIGPTVSSCWIEINPANFLTSSARNTLAHELFHCFQGVIMGLALYWHTPTHDWVVEGQAEWAAATVAGADRDDPRWWTDYLMNPGQSLISTPAGEGYRDIGFYSHLQESGINPWDVIPSMLTAPNDTTAFHAAVFGAGDGAAQEFLDSWASSFFREGSRGKAWDTTGPGIPAGIRPVAKSMRVAAGTTVTNEAKPYTEALYTLAPTADIVTLSGQGHVRLSDGTTDLLLSGPVDYCVKADGCECPEGKTYQGPPLTPLDAGRVAIGVTGGETGSTVAATGQSLDDLCSKRDPCVIGSWRVTDESAFVASTSGGVFVLSDMSGSQTMTFTKEGKVTVKADNFTIDVSEPSTGGSISLGITNGTTTADWDTPTKGDLEFTNVDVGDYALTIDGEVGSTGFFRGDSSSMAYTCSGNTLNLYLIPSDPSIAPIVLTKQSS